MHARRGWSITSPGTTQAQNPLREEQDYPRGWVQAGYTAGVTDEIRDRLVAERGRLSTEMEALRDGENVSMTERASTGDLSGNDQHPAEQGTETFERERDQSILEALENEMDEVQAALDRLEEGDYGSCEICGRPIGDERLEALPATRYCIEHETMRESLRGQPPTSGFEIT